MGPFQLECIAAGGDRAVLRIDGDIDAWTAPQLRERVRDLAGSGTVHLIADLRGVGFLDSAGHQHERPFALHSCVLEAVTADPNWQAAVSAGGLSAGIWCREHGLL